MDAATGKLGKLIASAEANINAGSVRSLDEIIHNVSLPTFQESEAQLMVCPS